MGHIFKIVTSPLRLFQNMPLQISRLPQRRLATEKSLNQVFLLGRVGTDPLPKGNEERPVVVFSLATNVNIKADDEGEYTQKTDWHRISVFKQSLRRTCMEHVKKGSRLFVQGRISYHSVATETNTMNKLFSIIADEIIVVNSTGNNFAKDFSDKDE